MILQTGVKVIQNRFAAYVYKERNHHLKKNRNLDQLIVFSSFLKNNFQ